MYIKTLRSKIHLQNLFPILMFGETFYMNCHYGARLKNTWITLPLPSQELTAVFSALFSVAVDIHL